MGRVSELLNSTRGTDVVMFEASRYQLLTPSRPHQPGVSTPWMILRASVARTPIAPSTANATPETSRSAGAMAGTTSSACSTVRPANTASPSARARPCSRLTCPNKGPAPCSNTSPKAAASDRPDALVDVHPNKAGQHALDAQDELVAFSPSDPRGPVRRDVVVRGQEAKELRSPQPGR